MNLSGTQRAANRRPLTAAVALVIVAAVVAGAPLVTSSASFTSRSANAPSSVGSAIDWTPPTVELADPGDAIRATVTLTATASDAETGVRQVAIAWAPADTDTWTTLCTRTAAPYSCSFPTTGLPEDFVDLRAVATDNAGFTATSLVAGVLVDNVAPTASLGTIASTLSGTVTIPVNAADAGSGVDTVTVQYARSGTTTWTTICTDTVAPWSCRFDTTQVADGTYVFRAIAVDVAGNTTTTATSTNRTIDNRASSISLEDPGPFVRGTEALVASPFAPTGIVSVRIDRRLAGTTTWTAICTDTAAPWGCGWDTTAVADGSYELRAVLRDGAGRDTVSAIVGPTRVDNTPVRGFDVQATNGATLGKVDAGDTVTVTYTRTMRPTSLLAGWDGTPRAVTVRLRDGAVLGLGGNDDTLDVFANANYTGPVNLGSVNLRGNYVQNGKTVGIGATLTQRTVTVNGLPVTELTITIGSQPPTRSNWLRTVTTATTMIWTPSAAAVDLDGIATSTAPVTEQGPVDRDL